MPPIAFVVDRRESGQTLAAVLKKRFGISWSQAKRLVENRHVRVGQQIETDVARRLKPGKRVLLDAGTIEASPTRNVKRETSQTRNAERGTRNKRRLEKLRMAHQTRSHYQQSNAIPRSALHVPRSGVR
jgi:23S rRNA pseudouridine1911/1915/1917 synthase